MARCNNCNKFTALNFEEPTVQSLDIDGDVPEVAG